MLPLTIVINLYVLKKNPLSFPYGFKLAMMNQLGLDRVKKGLSY